MTDHTTEGLVVDIEVLHDQLQDLHGNFGDVLVEILEVAREVYIRDLIAEGMTQYASYGTYYYANYNAKEVAAEYRECFAFWDDGAYDYDEYDDEEDEYDVEHMEIPFDDEA